LVTAPPALSHGASNDIGRVREFGSVQVRNEWIGFCPTSLTRPAAISPAPAGEGRKIIERYSHVMHIVSSVQGRLAADKTNYDLTCRDGRDHGGCGRRSGGHGESR